MRVVWLPTTRCPGLSHHYGTLQNGTRNGLKQHLHHRLCRMSISLGLLYFIYIFWYPVHCSGCEDSILIFVQSLI